MNVDPGNIATLAGALTAGGFLSEVFRAWRGRSKADLDLFYPTWKEEMHRLLHEVEELRRDVLSLSAEVHRLGGDPLAVRYGRLYSLEDRPGADNPKENT